MKDKFIVIWDTEMTSWEGCLKNGWDPKKNQFKELIQIGAIIINTENFKTIGRFNHYIKPKKNPKLSDYIKKLTKITQKQVDSAEDFEQVTSKFLKFIKNYNCYSYGNDLGVLIENKKLYKSKIKFNKKQFKDIRKIFKKAGLPVDKLHSGIISKHLGIKKKISEHNALADCESLKLGLEFVTKNAKLKK